MSSSFAPFPGPAASAPDADENEWWLRREMSLIQNLLEEEGELARGDIGDRLGCKYWGPMRFRSRAQGGRQPWGLPQDRAQPLCTGERVAGRWTEAPRDGAPQWRSRRVTPRHGCEGLDAPPRPQWPSALYSTRNR